MEHAAARGVDVLALTDHDDVGGLAEARAMAAERNITLINGVEISVDWRGQLFILSDWELIRNIPTSPGLSSIRDGRMVRARNIATQLDKIGIHGSFEGACRNAGEGHLMGRMHFARFLVQQGMPEM